MVKKALIGIAILWSLIGCGGNGGSGGSGPSAVTLLFISTATGSDTNVFVIKADGSLAAINTGQEAVWSRDGNTIAFDHLGDVFTMKPDGSGLFQLTHVASSVTISGASGPQWSPDGKRVTYIALCCGLVPSISMDIVNSDGSNSLTLVANAETAPWSPDGTKLLFVTENLEAPIQINNVGSVTADGATQVNLTNLTKANSISPVWSPSGSKVAFSSTRALDGSDAVNLNGTSNIWVVNADGTGAQPLTSLTASGANSTTPVWSADGTKIAFVSARALNGTDAANSNNTTNIWVMNADGSSAQPLTMLTSSGASSEAPDWSPDGTKLAFDSTRALNGTDAPNPSHNIWVIQANGSGATAMTNLASTGIDNTQPKWRP